MNIQHSSRTDEWGTPVSILYLVRQVMGPIELDPCSNSQWNMTVQAQTYLTDSLDEMWCAVPKNIFINPPGGKLHNKSLTSLFWNRLCFHKSQGLVRHAIWLGFSLEQLAISQSYCDDVMLNYTICIPKKRIQFDSSPGIPELAPSNSNFILYMPGCVDELDLFRETFSALGAVR